MALGKDNYSLIAFVDRGTTLADALAWLQVAGLRTAEVSNGTLYTARTKGPKAMRVDLNSGPTWREKLRLIAARHPGTGFPEGADACFVAVYDLASALVEGSTLTLVHQTLLERTGGALWRAWAPDGP